MVILVKQIAMERIIIEGNLFIFKGVTLEVKEVIVLV
jgi:hypothetical protein